MEEVGEDGGVVFLGRMLGFGGSDADTRGLRTQGDECFTLGGDIRLAWFRGHGSSLDALFYELDMQLTLCHGSRPQFWAKHVRKVNPTSKSLVFGRWE